MRKDLGLLLLRAGVGATLVAHGTQKLFGWFDGPGIEGTAAGFHQGGFRPAKHHAIAAGASEAGGGALLALGLATPAAGAAVVGTMAVAADMHKPGGFFAMKGGYEYPLTLGIAGASLALTGAGRLSVDRLLGDRLAKPWMAVVGLAGSIAAARMLMARRQAELAADARASEQQSASSESVESTVSGQATVTTSHAEQDQSAAAPTAPTL